MYKANLCPLDRLLGDIKQITDYNHPSYWMPGSLEKSTWALSATGGVIINNHQSINNYAQLLIS